MGQSKEIGDGQHTQSLSRLSLSIFGSKIFSTVALLLSGIYFSHKLPASDNGYYQGFWIQLYLFSAFTSAGLPLLIFTYSPEKLKALIKQLSNSTLLKYLFYAGIVCLLFGCLRYFQFKEMIVFNAFFLLIFTANIVFETLLNLQRKSAIITIINLIFAFAFLGLHVYCIWYGWLITQLFYSLLLLYLVKFVILYLFYRQSNLSIPNISLEKDDRKNAFMMWRHFVVYDTLGIFSRWLDKFILSLILTTSASAIYNNGRQEIPLLPLVLSVVSSGMLMELSRVNQQGNIAGVVNLIRSSTRLLAGIVLPLFVFLFVYAQDVVLILFGPQYIDSVLIFRISLFLLPLRIYSFTTLLIHYEQGKIINIGALIDLGVAMILIYPLFLWLGLGGVALSFVIATWVQSIYYFYHNQKILKQPVIKILPLKFYLLLTLGCVVVFSIVKIIGSSYFDDTLNFIIASGVLLFIELYFFKKNWSSKIV